MSALIQQCRSCSVRLFPERYFCPACGADGFRTVAVDGGTVETATTLSDGTVLATVNLDGGCRVIARLTGAAPAPGHPVRLTNALPAHIEDAAEGMQAYIPSNTPPANEDQ